MLSYELGAAQVFFTDRWDGGCSTARYASLNLADHVGDDPVAVRRNRWALAGELAASDTGIRRDRTEWVWLRQRHGARVATDPPLGSVPEADAAVTTERCRPLVVLTADCAPLALSCDGAVGVVHAGWMGLGAGVIEAAVGVLRTAGSGPVRAVLGPCIHPSSYEFGADLLERLVERLGPAVASRTTSGRPALDVPTAVRSALDRVGVDGFDDIGVCTAASPHHFSHRRDGVTGRQAVVAVLR